MSFNFSPDKGTTEHYVVPAGTYAARLYLIVDLGHQWTQFLNKPGKWSRQIYVGFEVPELTFEAEDKVTGEKTIKPRVIGRQYTLSYYKESRLKTLVQTLIGRALTDDEQNKTGYPLETLAGKPCLVSVIHKDSTKDGQAVTYANMDSIVAAPKGLTVPEQFNPMVVYCIEADPKRVVYDGLYQWLKDKIAKSQEFTGETETEEREPTAEELADTAMPFDIPEEPAEPAAPPEVYTYGPKNYTRAEWLESLHQAATLYHLTEPVDMDAMKHDDLQASGKILIKAMQDVCAATKKKAVKA